MKKNNQGFSLVELLVSIVILSIILIPVLDNIVMSSRMNKKSRQQQDVTTLAGNLLETTKIESDVSSMAENLLYQSKTSYFDLFSGMDTTNVSVTEVEKKKGVYQAVSFPCVTKNADNTYAFTENADRIYTFAVKGLSYNNSPYDALITYDASAYATSKDDVNAQDFPLLSSIATKENAVITEGYSDKWAASSLKHSFNQWFNTYQTGENNVTNDNIAENMTRQFTIQVSYNVSKAKYVVNGSIKYTLSDTLIPSVTGNKYDAYKTYENTIFESEFDSLQKVYLFYTPDLVHKSDTVTVKNLLPADKADLEFCLVEQNQTCTNYVAKMNSYTLRFNLEESAVKKEGTKRVYYTSFKNNLGVDQGATPAIRTNVTGMDVLHSSGLVEKEANKTRLYEVTVAIYHGGTKEEFSDENLLTTITSTKGVE